MTYRRAHQDQPSQQVFTNNGPNGALLRRAVIYQIHGQPGIWRTRVELHPQHHAASTGWYGGKVLYGHDQPSPDGARALAVAWTERGELPRSAA